MYATLKTGNTNNDGEVEIEKPEELPPV